MTILISWSNYRLLVHYFLPEYLANLTKAIQYFCKIFLCRLTYIVHARRFRTLLCAISIHKNKRLSVPDVM